MSENEAMNVYIATTFIATCMICNYTINEYTFDKYLGKFIREYKELKVDDRSMLLKVVGILMDDYFWDLLQQPFVHNHTLFKPMTGMTGMTGMTNAVTVTSASGGGGCLPNLFRKNDPMIIKKLREISLRKYDPGSYPDELKRFIEFLNNKQIDMRYVEILFDELEEAVVNAIKELPTEKTELQLEVNIQNIPYEDDGFRNTLILAMFREKKDLIKKKDLGNICLQRIIQIADNIYAHFLHIDAGVLGNVVKAGGGYVENLLKLLYGAYYVDNSDESEQAFLHAFRYLEGKNDYDDLGVLGVGQALEMSGVVGEIKENADDRDAYREELGNFFVGLFENNVVQKYKEFNVVRNLLLFLDPTIHERIQRIRNSQMMTDPREKDLFKLMCVTLVRLVDRLNLNTSINKKRKGFTTRIKTLVPPPEIEFSQYLNALNKLLVNEIRARFVYVQKAKSRNIELATLEEFIGNEHKYVYRVILRDEINADLLSDLIKALFSFTNILLEYAPDDYSFDIFMKLITYINGRGGYKEKLDNIIEPIIGGEGGNYVIEELEYEADEEITKIYKKVKNIFRIWLYLFIQVFEIRVGEDVRGKFGTSVDDVRMDLQGVIDGINQANGYGLQGNGGGLRGNKMVKKYVEGLYTCKDKKKRKAYRVVGEGNRLFVMCKGVHTRVGDVGKGKK